MVAGARVARRGMERISPGARRRRSPHLRRNYCGETCLARKPSTRAPRRARACCSLRTLRFSLDAQACLAPRHCMLRHVCHLARVSGSCRTIFSQHDMWNVSVSLCVVNMMFLCNYLGVVRPQTCSSWPKSDGMRVMAPRCSRSM
jgi:hypothetical protein